MTGIISGDLLCHISYNFGFMFVKKGEVIQRKGELNTKIYPGKEGALAELCAGSKRERAHFYVCS